jgi:hypothetical protein
MNSNYIFNKKQVCRLWILNKSNISLTAGVGVRVLDLFSSDADTIFKGI